MSILEQSYRGDIEEVVVTRKDRLCRFAFELVEWIFVKHDTKIVVLGSDVNIDDTESGELAENLQHERYEFTQHPKKEKS